MGRPRYLWVRILSIRWERVYTGSLPLFFMVSFNAPAMNPYLASVSSDSGSSLYRDLSRYTSSLATF